MTTFSCFLFQCRIVQDYIIPKAADDMEIALTHRRYESFLGKECVCNHRSGYALYLVFSTDKITAIPVYEVFTHIIQGLTIRRLKMSVTR